MNGICLFFLSLFCSVGMSKNLNISIVMRRENYNCLKNVSILFSNKIINKSNILDEFLLEIEEGELIFDKESDFEMCNFILKY